MDKPFFERTFVTDQSLSQNHINDTHARARAIIFLNSQLLFTVTYKCLTINFRIKIFVKNMVMHYRRYSFDDLVLKICCQDHLSEQYVKSFSCTGSFSFNRSLFIKKLLTKEIWKIKKNKD